MELTNKFSEWNDKNIMESNAKLLQDLFNKLVIDSPTVFLKEDEDTRYYIEICGGWFCINLEDNKYVLSVTTYDFGSYDEPPFKDFQDLCESVYFNDVALEVIAAYVKGMAVGYLDKLYAEEVLKQEKDFFN